MPDEKEEPIEGIEVELTTREEYVTLSCKAIDTVVALREGMDLKLMSKEDQACIKRIVSNAISVIDSNLQDMYNETFPEE